MKKLYKILIIGILVLILMAAGTIIYFQLLAKDNNPEELTILGPVFETEEFTVNVSTFSNRYIQAQFALELSDEKVKKELNEKIVMLQDTIITVLSKQTLEALSQLEGKNALKESLIKEINTFLDKGEIKKIYFKKIIIS